MPLATDPAARTRFSLRLDMKRPVEERAVFIGRFLTFRQRRQLEELRAAALKEADEEKGFEFLCRVFDLALVGVENLRAPEGEAVDVGPGDWGALKSALTDLEIWELPGALVQAAQLGEIETKKSDAPSPTGSDESAGGNVPNPAGDAGTPRA